MLSFSADGGTFCRPWGEENAHCTPWYRWHPHCAEHKSTHDTPNDPQRPPTTWNQLSYPSDVMRSIIILCPVFTEGWWNHVECGWICPTLYMSLTIGECIGVYPHGSANVLTLTLFMKLRPKAKFLLIWEERESERMALLPGERREERKGCGGSCIDSRGGVAPRVLIKFSVPLIRWHDR